MGTILSSDVSNSHLIKDIPTEFHKVKEITSRVHKVKSVLDKTDYSLKEYRTYRLHKSLRPFITSELFVLKTLAHPYLHSIQQVYQQTKTTVKYSNGVLSKRQDQKHYLISQWVRGGTLSALLQKRIKREKFLTEDELMEFFVMVLLGLEQTHEQGVIHRNISSEHVYLATPHHLKLASHANNTYKRHYESIAKICYEGEHFYLCPTVANGHTEYTMASDMWALGMLLFEMASLWQKPFYAPCSKNFGHPFQQQEIDRGQQHMINEALPRYVHDVIDALLQIDPTKRPTCKQLIMVPGVYQKVNEVLRSSNFKILFEDALDFRVNKVALASEKDQAEFLRFKEQTTGGGNLAHRYFSSYLDRLLVMRTSQFGFLRKLGQPFPVTSEGENLAQLMQRDAEILPLFTNKVLVDQPVDMVPEPYEKMALCLAEIEDFYSSPSPKDSFLKTAQSESDNMSMVSQSLEEQLQEHPCNAEYMVQMAHLLVKRNKQDKNIDILLKQALRIDPKNVVGLQLLAVHQFYHTFYQECSKTLQQLLKTDRDRVYDEDYAHNLFLLGKVQQKLGHNLKAISSFRSCLGIDLDHHGASLHLANLLLSTEGYSQRAAKYFQNTIRVNPISTAAHFGLMLAVKRHAQSTDLAKQHLKNLVRADPSNQHHLLTQLAILHFYDYEDELAIARLRDCLAENRNFVPALVTLAEVCRYVGRAKMSTKYYKCALQVDGSQMMALKGLICAENDLLGELTAGSGRDQKINQMYWYFDRVRKMQKDLNLVEHDLLEVHSYCKLDLGNSFFELGQRQRAEQLYLDALRVDPTFAKITDNIIQLAKSYHASNQPRKATELLLNSLKLHHDFKKAKTYLLKVGEKFVERGERTKAFEIFSEILIVCPHETKNKNNLESLQWKNSLEWRRTADSMAISEKVIISMLVKICKFLTERLPTTQHIKGNISGENFYLLDRDFLEFSMLAKQPQELEMREEQRTCYVQSGEMDPNKMLKVKKKNPDLDKFLNSQSFASTTNFKQKRTLIEADNDFKSQMNSTFSANKEGNIRNSLPEIQWKRYQRKPKREKLPPMTTTLTPRLQLSVHSKQPKQEINLVVAQSIDKKHIEEKYLTHREVTQFQRSFNPKAIQVLDGGMTPKFLKRRNEPYFSPTVNTLQKLVPSICLDKILSPQNVQSPAGSVRGWTNRLETPNTVRLFSNQTINHEQKNFLSRNWKQPHIYAEISTRLQTGLQLNKQQFSSVKAQATDTARVQKKSTGPLSLSLMVNNESARNLMSEGSSECEEMYLTHRNLQYFAAQTPKKTYEQNPFQSDIQSLGFLLLQLVTLEDSQTLKDQVILLQEIPKISMFYTENLQELITQMLSNQLSAAEILDLAFIKNHIDTSEEQKPVYLPEQTLGRSFSEFEEDYQDVRKLGSHVTLVERRKDKKLFVAKQQLNLLKGTKELTDLESINITNTVNFIECFQDEGQIILIMEYCDFGSLTHQMEYYQDLNNLVPEEQVIHTLKQICKGLQHTHKKSIIHNNITPKNLFVFQSGQVKIGDFGLSKVKTTDSVNYVAPETLLNEKISGKTDIWAIGCILHEFMTGKQTFKKINENAKGKEEKLKSYGEPARLPKIYTRELRYLVHLMLVKNQEQRPSATEILYNDLIRFHKKERLDLPKNDNFPYGILKKEGVKIGPIKTTDQSSFKTTSMKLIDKLKQKTSIKCIEIRTQQSFTDKKAVKIITKIEDSKDPFHQEQQPTQMEYRQETETTKSKLAYLTSETPSSEWVVDATRDEEDVFETTKSIILSTMSPNAEVSLTFHPDEKQLRSMSQAQLIKHKLTEIKHKGLKYLTLVWSDGVVSPPADTYVYPVRKKKRIIIASDSDELEEKPTPENHGNSLVSSMKSIKITDQSYLKTETSYEEEEFKVDCVQLPEQPFHPTIVQFHTYEVRGQIVSKKVIAQMLYAIEFYKTLKIMPEQQVHGKTEEVKLRLCEWIVAAKVQVDKARQVPVKIEFVVYDML